MSGQLEVTTTPYTHPILPLLADTNSGRVAVPQMTLPAHRFQWAEDIPATCEKLGMYQDLWTGTMGYGLQSVSPKFCLYIARQGFKWIALKQCWVDVEALFFSTAMAGNVLEPRYYTNLIAWKRQLGSSMFSRPPIIRFDWFHYGSMQPSGRRWFVGHLGSDRPSHKTQQPEQPWLVTIALTARIAGNFIPKMASLPRKFVSNPERPFPVETCNGFWISRLFPSHSNTPSDKLHSGFGWMAVSLPRTLLKNRAWDLWQRQGTVLRIIQRQPENNPKHGSFVCGRGFWLVLWFGEGHSSKDAILTSCFGNTCVAYTRRWMNQPLIYTNQWKPMRCKLTTDRKGLFIQIMGWW